MSDMDLNDNAELFDTFISEGYELLDEVEPRLIELQERTESDSCVDGEVLNSIFRIFHTIKGTAGFLELSNLQKVTHEAETLLDLYRSGKVEPTPEHVRLLLRTCDFIRKILTNIEQYMHDKGFEPEAEKIVEDLAGLYRGGGEEEEKKEGEPETTAGGEGAGENEKSGEELPPPGDEPGMDMIVTKEMVEQFVKEGLDLLEELESSLLTVENEPDNREHIENSFRTLHTFKGNCGFLGFGDLERLSHKTESLLEYMRDGAIKPDKQTVRMVLNIVDTLKEGVADVADGGNGAINGCELLVEFLDDEIKASLGEGGGTKQPVSSGGGAPEEEGYDGIESAPGKEGDETNVPESAVRRDDVPGTSGSRDARPGSGVEKERTSPGESGGAPVSHSAVRKDIRVDLEKVDKLVDLVGELALAEDMVIQNPDLQGMSHDNFDRAAHQLDKIISEIQYVSMSLRMIPIAGIFRKMIRLVHDLSYKTGKKVRLETAGEETEIDKTVADNIGDPLVHIVRNAIDHGIETPEEREKLGKNPIGKVSIEAKHEGGEVWIVIRDDGRGLNREKILEKAVARGLVAGDGSELTDEEVFRFIFEPGFSTAGRISEISGRGVGMDVVRKNMERINGTVDIQSAPGRGTTITLRIPLTLATMEGMLVQVGASRYTIPLMSIRECIKPDPKDITVSIDGQEIVKVRGELLPVIRLHELFRITPEHYELESGHLIILQHRDQSFCVAVDRIIGQQQVVIKGLSDYIGNVRCVSGCTILGDGEVSLILDVGAIYETAANGPAREQAECRR